MILQHQYLAKKLLIEKKTLANSRQFKISLNLADSVVLEFNSTLNSCVYSGERDTLCTKLHMKKLIQNIGFRPFTLFS